METAINAEFVLMRSLMIGAAATSFAMFPRMAVVYSVLFLIFLSSMRCAEGQLFLTPLIARNELALARNASRVGPLEGYNVPLSYSGFLTVNETTNSNLFFWFFPALSPQNTTLVAPTILWLQGGPGASSLFGLFVEHGPYEVSKNITLMPREASWARSFNMLYIDSPVGAGFSFTDQDLGYAKNFSDVGKDLLEGLQQFLKMFSEYEHSDFYVAGESFAGKFVPALAHEILGNKERARMNFQGIMIGSGLCDPPSMMNYGDYLLSLGLISEIDAKYFKRQERVVQEYLKEEDYLNAFRVFVDLIDGDRVNKTKTYFKRRTGYRFKFNALQAKKPEAYEYYKEFLKLNSTREALHLGNASFSDGNIVREKLRGEFMKSVKNWIEEVLENQLRVLIYNGQFDIIVPYPLTRSFVNSIKWSGAESFSEVRRQVWRNSTTAEPMGYVRQSGLLTEVMVRNAGHIMPYDAPEAASDMIDRFINKKPFSRSSRWLRTTTLPAVSRVP